MNTIRVPVSRSCRTERETKAILVSFLQKPHYTDIGLENNPAGGWIVKATRPANVRELRKLQA